MKSTFQGYYSPTADELKILWSEGIFVLDTNVLLHLYRVPDATRAQMLSALKALKGRLWVPRHVGIEYQRRRLGAIHTAHQKTAAVLKEIDRALEGYELAVGRAELEERGVKGANEPLQKIKEQAAKVRATVESTLAGQLSPVEHDVIRDEVDALFEGGVGPGPKDQATVDAWDAEGTRRFEMKRGPGFDDIKKAEADEPTFYAQGLVYQKQFGDLYIWLQMLEYVRTKSVKNLVFVTQDGKEDWWRLAPGKERDRARLAPLESLAEEVRQAGADMFWMYQLDGFLRDAEKQLKVEVSDLTIKDAGNSEAVAEDSKRTGDIARGNLYGVRELVAVVRIVADEKIFESERLAAGIKRQPDGGYTGEIVLLPGLAVDRNGLGDVLRDVIDTLDLLSPIKVINVYLLTRALRKTEFQARAAWNFQEMVATLAPDMECKVRVVRFAGEDRTRLREIASLGG